MTSTIALSRWDTYAHALFLHFYSNCLGDAVAYELDGRTVITWIQDADAVVARVPDPRDRPLTIRQRARLANSGWEGPQRSHGRFWIRALPWHPQGALDIADSLVAVMRDILELPVPAAGTHTATNGTSVFSRHYPLTLPDSPDSIATAMAVGRLRDKAWAWRVSAGRQALAGPFPGAQTLATIGLPPNRLPGRPTADDPDEYFVDRILLIPGPEPHLMIVSDVAAHRRLGYRYVPAQTEAPWTWEPQGSEPYIRHLITTSTTLARLNHQLRARVTALLSPKKLAIRACFAAFHSGNAVQITPAPLDMAKLAQPNLLLLPTDA